MASVDLIADMIRIGREAEASNVGYDQWQRWTWLDRANRQIIPNRETDCSALCAGVAWLAGYDVDISGTCWTGNLASLMRAAGWSVLRYTRASSVLPGDMVLNQRSHVVLALSPTEWLSAERDERGRATGGQPGDQDGREVVIRAPYERSGGWDYILRPPGAPEAPASRPAHATTAAAMPFDRLAEDGLLGPRTISAIQWWVGVSRDGLYGPQTRRGLQAALGVTVDGIVGRQTVSTLQRLVGASVDGIWGPQTTRALQAWLNRRAGY